MALKDQRAAGLRTVTDGEFCRASWHMDFICSLGGIRQVEGESLHVQFRNEQGEYDYAPSAGADFLPDWRARSYAERAKRDGAVTGSRRG